MREEIQYLCNNLSDVREQVIDGIKGLLLRDGSLILEGQDEELWITDDRYAEATSYPIDTVYISDNQDIVAQGNQGELSLINDYVTLDGLIEIYGRLKAKSDDNSW